MNAVNNMLLNTMLQEVPRKLTAAIREDLAEQRSGQPQSILDQLSSTFQPQDIPAILEQSRLLAEGNYAEAKHSLHLGFHSLVSRGAESPDTPHDNKGGRTVMEALIDKYYAATEAGMVITVLNNTLSIAAGNNSLEQPKNQLTTAKDVSADMATCIRTTVDSETIQNLAKSFPDNLQDIGLLQSVLDMRKSAQI